MKESEISPPLRQSKEKEWNELPSKANKLAVERAISQRVNNESAEEADSLFF